VVSGRVGAVVKACNYVKQPSCKDFTSRFWFKGERLSDCISKRCNDRTTRIRCNANVTGDCGLANTFGHGSMWIYGGHANCPKQQGFGYAPTIFHETLYLCGIEQEPTSGSQFSNVFKKAMELCTGYQW
jgi:hypothetical protein